MRHSLILKYSRILLEFLRKPVRLILSVKTPRFSHAIGDDIVLLKKAFLLLKFVFVLIKKTIWLALKASIVFLISLINPFRWPYHIQSIIQVMARFCAWTARLVLVFVKKLLEFCVLVSMRIRLLLFVSRLTVHQFSQGFWRTLLIISNYFFVHLFALKILWGQLEHFHRLFAQRRWFSFRQLLCRLKDMIYLVRLGVTFLYSASVIRLKDLHLPEAIETGYPLSWTDVAKLCEAMYQNNGFFFWTLNENINRGVIKKLQEAHQLPLYLDLDRRTFRDVPELLMYFKTNFATTEAPYCFAESLYCELYSDFLENFKLVLLQELKHDPFAVIRVNLVNYETLQQSNLYTTYILDGGILDRLFTHWEGIFENNTGELISFLTKQNDQLLFLRNEEDFFTYCSSRRYFELFNHDWFLYYYQLYVEIFVSYYPYLFYWGKATNGMGGVMLPIFAIFGKPFYYTPEPFMLVIYALWAYYYSVNVMRLDSASEEFLPNEANPVLYEDWYLQFRFDCLFFFNFDPEGEDEYDFVQYFIPWILIAPYIDKKRRVPHQKHLYDTPDYRKYLVSAADRLYSGKIHEDTYLSPYLSEVSPLLILMDHWNDRGYKFVRMFKGVRNKVWPIANYDCRVSPFYAEDELFILGVLDNLFVRTHHGSSDEYVNPILVDAAQGIKKNYMMWRPYSFTGFTRKDARGHYFKYKSSYRVRRPRLYEYDFELARYRPYAWKKIFKPLYRQYKSNEWEQFYRKFAKCWLPYDTVSFSSILRHLPALDLYQLPALLKAENKEELNLRRKVSEEYYSRFVFWSGGRKPKVRDVLDSDRTSTPVNILIGDTFKPPIETGLLDTIFREKRQFVLQKAATSRNQFFTSKFLKVPLQDADFESTNSHIEIFDDLCRKTWYRKRIKNVNWSRRPRKASTRAEIRENIQYLQMKDNTYYSTFQNVLKEPKVLLTRIGQMPFFSRRKWRDLDYLPPSDSNVSRTLVTSLFKVSDLHFKVKAKVKIKNRLKRDNVSQLLSYKSELLKPLKPNLIHKYETFSHRIGLKDNLQLVIAANYAKLLRNSGPSFYTLTFDTKKSPFFHTSSVSHLFSYIGYTPKGMATRALQQRLRQQLADILTPSQTKPLLLNLRAQKLYSLLYVTDKHAIVRLVDYFYGLTNLKTLVQLEICGASLYNEVKGVINLSRWSLGGDFYFDYTYNDYNLSSLNEQQYLHYCLVNFFVQCQHLFVGTTNGFMEQLHKLPGESLPESLYENPMFSNLAVYELSLSEYYNRFFNALDLVPRGGAGRYGDRVKDTRLSVDEYPNFDIEMVKLSQNMLKQFFSSKEHLAMLATIAKNAPEQEHIASFPTLFLQKTIWKTVNELLAFPAKLLDSPTKTKNLYALVKQSVLGRVSSSKNSLGLLDVEKAKFLENIKGNSVKSLQSYFKTFLYELEIPSATQRVYFDIFKKLDQNQQTDVLFDLYLYYSQLPSFVSSAQIQLYSSNPRYREDIFNFGKVSWLHKLLTWRTAESRVTGSSNDDVRTLQENLNKYILDELCTVFQLPESVITDLFKKRDRQMAWAELFRYKKLRYREALFLSYKQKEWMVDIVRGEHMADFFGNTFMAKIAKYLPHTEDALANFHFFRRPTSTNYSIWQVPSDLEQALRALSGPFPKDDDNYTTIFKRATGEDKKIFLKVLSRFGKGYVFRPRSRRRINNFVYNRVYVPPTEFDRSAYIKAAFANVHQEYSGSSWLAGLDLTLPHERAKANTALFNHLQELLQTKQYKDREHLYRRDALLQLKARYLGKVTKANLKILKAHGDKGKAGLPSKLFGRDTRPYSRRVSFIEYLNQHLNVLGGIKFSDHHFISRYKLLAQRAFLSSIHECVQTRSNVDGRIGYLIGQSRVRLYADSLIEPWLAQSSDLFLNEQRARISDIITQDTDFPMQFLHHSHGETDPVGLTNLTDSLLHHQVQHSMARTLRRERLTLLNDTSYTFRGYSKRRAEVNKVESQDERFSINLNEWYQILQSSTESQLLHELKEPFSHQQIAIQVGPGVEEFIDAKTISAQLKERLGARVVSECTQIKDFFFYYKLYYSYNIDKTNVLGIETPRDITRFGRHFDIVFGMHVMPEIHRAQRLNKRHNKIKFQRLQDMRGFSQYLLADMLVLQPVDGFPFLNQNGLNDALEYSVDFDEDFEMAEERNLVFSPKKGKTKSALWSATRGGLLEMYEQSLLVGIYNATQLSDSPLKLFLQNHSVFTPLDLYGLYCENSLGHGPTIWFNIYDQVENEILNPSPYLHFAFKDTTFITRYKGYYRPEGLSSTLHTEFSLLENIESILTGFTEMESHVGLEYAITFYWYNYFGVAPGTVLDFLLYSCYWSTNWLNAIYNGMFIESHIELGHLNRVETALVEFEALTNPIKLPSEKNNINWFLYDQVTRHFQVQQYENIDPAVFDAGKMYLYEMVFVRLANAVNNLDQYAFPTDTRPRSLLEKVLEDNRLRDLASGKIPPETETFNEKYGRGHQIWSESANMEAVRAFQDCVTQVYFFSNSYQKSIHLMKLHDTITRHNLVAAERYLAENEARLYDHTTEYGDENIKADMLYLRSDLSLRNREMLRGYYDFILWCNRENLAAIYEIDPFTLHYFTPEGNQLAIIWGDDFSSRDYFQSRGRKKTHIQFYPVTHLSPEEIEVRLSRFLYSESIRKYGTKPHKYTGTPNQMKAFIRRHDNWINAVQQGKSTSQLTPTLFQFNYAQYIDAPVVVEERKPTASQLSPSVVQLVAQPEVNPNFLFDADFMAARLEEHARESAQRNVPTYQSDADFMAARLEEVSPNFQFDADFMAARLEEHARESAQRNAERMRNMSEAEQRIEAERLEAERQAPVEYVPVMSEAYRRALLLERIEAQRSAILRENEAQRDEAARLENARIEARLESERQREAEFQRIEAEREAFMVYARIEKAKIDAKIDAQIEAQRVEKERIEKERIEFQRMESERQREAERQAHIANCRKKVDDALQEAELRREAYLKHAQRYAASNLSKDAREDLARWSLAVRGEQSRPSRAEAALSRNLGVEESNEILRLRNEILRQREAERQAQVERQVQVEREAALQALSPDERDEILRQRNEKRNEILRQRNEKRNEILRQRAAEQHEAERRVEAERNEILRQRAAERKARAERKEVTVGEALAISRERQAQVERKEQRILRPLSQALSQALGQAKNQDERDEILRQAQVERNQQRAAERQAARERDDNARRQVHEQTGMFTPRAESPQNTRRYLKPTNNQWPSSE